MQFKNIAILSLASVVAAQDINLDDLTSAAGGILSDITGVPSALGSIATEVPSALASLATQFSLPTDEAGLQSAFASYSSLFATFTDPAVQSLVSAAWNGDGAAQTSIANLVSDIEDDASGIAAGGASSTNSDGAAPTNAAVKAGGLLAAAGMAGVFLL